MWTAIRAFELVELEGLAAIALAFSCRRLPAIVMGLEIHMSVQSGR
jgi:hypothetical protein